MKIGDLATASATPVDTIRYYEREGLLPAPARTAANYRAYDDSHLERLRFIRNCRALDMTHEEIRGLLRLKDAPAEDCGAVNTLLDDHIGHVDARIAELLHLKQQLGALRQQCQVKQAVDACGILRGLAAMEADTQVERHTHLG